MSECVQAFPTGHVHGVWQFKRKARYPDLLEVQMSDGTTVIYQIKMMMPAPRLETPEGHVTVGYERRDDDE